MPCITQVYHAWVMSLMEYLPDEANRDEIGSDSPFHVTQRGVKQVSIHNSPVNPTGDEFRERFILLHHA